MRIDHLSSTKKRTSTYSMWSTFANCQRRAYWRYIREMVPVVIDPALAFGKLIHECLAIWYQTGSSEKVLSAIDANYPRREYDADQLKHWHYAMAMMTAYIQRYVMDSWRVIGIEQEFKTKLTNPATGWSSHSFCLRGKVDGIVDEQGRLFVAEHKTATMIDAAYIEALNLSLQADIYSFAIGEGKREPVGVIYNVLRKPLLRKIDANFQARLLESLSGPESFQRFTFLYDANDRRRLQAELWELGKRWLDCERRGVWLQNRGACFWFRKPCPYFKLCTSRDDQFILDEFYEYKRAHSELTQEEDPDATT